MKNLNTLNKQELIALLQKAEAEKAEAIQRAEEAILDQYGLQKPFHWQLAVGYTVADSDKRYEMGLMQPKHLKACRISYDLVKLFEEALDAGVLDVWVTNFDTPTTPVEIGIDLHDRGVRAIRKDEANPADEESILYESENYWLVTF